MPLTEHEELSARQLLAHVPEPDVMALCETVTKGFKTPKSLPDAVNAIVKYSSSSRELLRRKRVTRECLLKYLEERSITPTPATDKPTLVGMIVRLWRGENPEEEVPPADATEESGVEVTERVAQLFSNFFYSSLNAHHFTSTEDGLRENLAPQIFWPDAQLYLKVESSTREVMAENTFYGAEHIIEALKTLVVREQAKFNVASVTWQCDEHGLLAVKISGTLHDASRCTGVFDQDFGLVRDPARETDWRVKSTSLWLRVQLPATEQGRIRSS